MSVTTLPCRPAPLGSDSFLCPRCGGRSFVADSRSIASGIRRRRKCAGCGGGWTTYETSKRIPDLLPLLAATRASLAEAIRLIDELTDGEQHG